MNEALILLYKMLPIYVLVLLGWIAGRFLDVRGNYIAGMMLYILTPSVVFSGVMSAPLSPEVLALPFLTFLLCTLVGYSHLLIARRWMRDATASLMPLTVGTGNTGYLGIPVALLLFGEAGLGIYILCMLGTTLYENSVGFYLAARGRFSVADCLKKVARLPSLYGFFLAAALNLSGVGIPSVFQPLFDNLRGAYSVLGMMLIGMSILSFRGLAGDLRYTALAFFGKFVVWPALALAFWWFDSNGPQWYNQQVYQALFLVSITPIAANTVVIANVLNLAPAQVAGTALLSTLLALFTIPLMIAVFLGA